MQPSYDALHGAFNKKTQAKNVSGFLGGCYQLNEMLMGWQCPAAVRCFIPNEENVLLTRSSPVTFPFLYCPSISQREVFCLVLYHLEFICNITAFGPVVWSNYFSALKISHKVASS